jgi:hypothetical protein
MLAIVPLSVGALWTLGLMALLQAPVNVANLLLLPLVMGIGIDNGIYIVHRFWMGRGTAEPLVPLARSMGRAVPLSSMTIVVGFGNLMISSHRGIHRLGLLVALEVGKALLAALTVFPILLAVLAARARKRAASRIDHEDTALTGIRLVSRSTWGTMKLIYEATMSGHGGRTRGCITQDIAPRTSPEVRLGLNKIIHPTNARWPIECMAILSHTFASPLFQSMYYVPSYQRGGIEFAFGDRNGSRLRQTRRGPIPSGRCLFKARPGRT